MKTKRKIFSLVLSLVMMVSLWAGIGPMEAKAAANFEAPIIEEITLHDSGCLKKITITIEAIPMTEGSWNEAYGKIAIHNAETSYGYTNRVLTGKNLEWPDESTLIQGDRTTIGFAVSDKDKSWEADEFLWTDCDPHKITFEFADGKINLLDTANYYIYLWSRALEYGIYPDHLLGTIHTENGSLYFNNAEVTKIPATVIMSPTLTNATIVADLKDKNGTPYNETVGTVDPKRLNADTDYVVGVIRGVRGYEMSADKVPTVTTNPALTTNSLGTTESGETIPNPYVYYDVNERAYYVMITGFKANTNTVISITGEAVQVEAGEVDSDSYCDPDAPIEEATLNNSIDELSSLFTPDELNETIYGEDLYVWLEIYETDETAITAEKAMFEEKAAQFAGNNPTITYFDVDLYKQVGEYGSSEEIDEPGVAIKVSVKVPDQLLNTNAANTRQYKILRLHNGQVDLLDATFDATNKTLSFVSDKFSTYAIIYKDVPVPTTSTPDNNTPASDPAPAPVEPVKDQVPKTGENNVALYVLLLALVSGVGVLVSSRKKEA